MPLITEKITTTHEQIVGFICDRCGIEYHDDISMQERFNWWTTGGYGSVWGDGRTWHLVMCQGCANSLLSPWARDVTDRGVAGTASHRGTHGVATSLPLPEAHGSIRVPSGEAGTASHSGTQ